MNNFSGALTSAAGLASASTVKGPTIQMALDEQMARLKELGATISDLEIRLQPILEMTPNASGSGTESPKPPSGILYTIGEHNDIIGWYIKQIGLLVNRLHL